MKQFRSHLMQGLPFLAILGILLIPASMRAFALCNVLVQTLLFLFVVMIPAHRTGRMAYVDLGWPIGLFLIGIQVLVFGDGSSARTWVIGAAYLFAGGRMGAMAIIGWRTGWLDRELPRYQYQRLRWARRGWKEKPALLFEVALQGVANMSVLAVPAIVQAGNRTVGLSGLEIVAAVLWVMAFVFEFTADAQKMRFGVRMRNAQRRGEHCAEGLWKYSRHPNYFGEWMVWNALVLGTIASLLQLDMWLAAMLGVALVFLSYTMYTILTHYSGAVPAEYYSVQKRPGYAGYQKTTNRFFPGPRRLL